MTQTFAVLYAVIIALTVVFQVFVILGAPLGKYTQGGQHDSRLPWPNRFFAGLSILLLLAMCFAVLSAVEIWPNWPIWTGWACFVLQAISTILNWITPSSHERWVWGPITSVMLVLVSTVMFS